MLKLTTARSDGHPVWIAPEHVCYVQKMGGDTWIEFQNSSVYVTESQEEVVAAIEQALVHK